MAQPLFPIQEQDLASVIEGSSETEQTATHPHESGLTWNRIFGKGHPYDEITWEIRDARITKGNGQVVFEQKNVEIPAFWTQTATDIVASKYFRGRLGTPEREYSAKQMVDRVADTISSWGFKGGYFKTAEDYENFRNDLKYLLINQYAAFNSPVWFNVGVFDRPQCSACFILAVDDHMKSILEWYVDEGWIFRGGSGSGTNLSKLRSSKEPLSRGGFSSGPVSFMKGADGVANSIRSGGTTRRAAKMVILNADHPDIKDFIYCKKTIEEMVRTLENSGVKNGLDTEIFDPYTLLPYQNANNSVRVTDEFMRAVENDQDWNLTERVTGKVSQTLKARELMHWISDAAWHSADPGMQFDTIINEWHTCPNTGRINASNPCSEYMHLDNSACNLASINLLKFLRPDGSYDVEMYKQVISTMITAQEITVSNSSYPTPKITQNAYDYRELGLGYANLGALLMSMGYPYDSDEGRAVAGALTSILSGQAYLDSAKIAKVTGPFAGYQKNRQPMLNVIRKHGTAAEKLATEYRNIFGHYDLLGNGNGNGNGHTNGLGNGHASHTSWREELISEAVNVWQEALIWGEKFGYRNSQATVLAPTGTIAFLMDCDTTGVEPELALVKYKKLVGGGTLKLVNNQLPQALKNLGYKPEQIKEISEYVIEKETIEGAPHIKDDHLPVFDCSFKAQNGNRSISYMGHIRMMGAAQPFISGAISKTVNLPTEATIDDIRDAYMQAWKLGLKAIAVYRDGCKSVQPLNTSSEAKDKNLIEKVNGYTRIKLPDERPSITHKFTVGGHDGYLHIGLYPETKKPGEVFITIAKEGSTLSGLLDVIATQFSICLQSGVPLKVLIKKFKDSRFEPSGMTNNPEIPFAKSFMDYIVRYMGSRFLDRADKEEIFGHAPSESGTEEAAPILVDIVKVQESRTIPISMPEMETGWADKQETGTDAPLCSNCGAMMFRAGSCFSCPNCFATTGVCN